MVVCPTNPCENEGSCRIIETTREAVCACRPGYTGPYCSICKYINTDHLHAPTHTIKLSQCICVCVFVHGGGLAPEERCYKESGVQYRGTANITLSGAHCLPWSSDLLYNELSPDTLHDASQRGLGDHAFCRSEKENHMHMHSVITITIS